MKKVSYITVVGVIALGAVIYLIWKKRKENAAKTGGTTGSTTTAAAPSGATAPGTTTGAGSTGSTTTAGGTLKYFTPFERAQYLIKGSSGDQVKALQSFLNDNAINNAAPLTIDGQFGQATENALDAQFNRISIALDMLNIAGLDTSTGQYFTGWGQNPLWGIAVD